MKIFNKWYIIKLSELTDILKTIKEDFHGGDMDYYDIVPEINKVFYREANEDWSIPQRVINDHQFVLFTEGRGYYIIEGKKYPVRKGMFCYIYPGLVHSAETNPIDPLKFYYVHFNIANVDYNNGDWKAITFNSVLPINTIQILKNYQSYLDMFNKLNEFANSFVKDYIMFGRIILENLIYTLIQDSKKQVLNYSKHLKIERIMDYLQKNIDKKITLEDISEMVRLSQPYVSRIFKEETGYNFVEFFNRLKIDAAKTLIMEESGKIKEVANAIGILDEFYFSRLFKKIEGISPTAFYYKNVKKS